MNEKERMIKKILSDSFINVQDITAEQISEFDLFNKLETLGCSNIDSWKQVIELNPYRVKSLVSKEEYIAFVIRNDMNLTYQYRGTISELKEKYNLINFALIDKLIEYKNNKIEVKDLVSFITNK